MLILIVSLLHVCCYLCMYHTTGFTNTILVRSSRLPVGLPPLHGPPTAADATSTTRPTAVTLLLL